jgi:hypothetical protein
MGHGEISDDPELPLLFVPLQTSVRDSFEFTVL